jgi:hypothetical protein
MESEEVKNQEYERTNVEFSNGYSTSTSQSNTGAVSLSGAYLNAEGEGSTEGDKPKVNTQSPSSYNGGRRLIGTKNENKNFSDVLAAGWGAALVEPTPAGEIIMGAATIGVGIYAFATSEMIQKMAREIDRIAVKTLPNNGAVYELRVRKAGTYIDVRGVPVQLNAGDIWKYGETINGQGRYSNFELNTMIPGGVIFKEFYWGNQVQIKIMEKYMIYGYFFNHGSLPPGNKIFR